MLLGLQKKEPKRFVEDNKSSTENPSCKQGEAWQENSEDVIIAGSRQWMSHQDRYEFVKNRSYSKTKPTQ